MDRGPQFSDGALVAIFAIYAGYLFAGAAIAAAGLRLAVRVFNRLAGAPVVPKPKWGNAIAICVATTIGGLVAALGVLMAVYSVLPGNGDLNSRLIFTALSMAVAWLIMAGLCRWWLLPTTFPRALGVAGIVFAVYVPLVMLGFVWPVP